MKANDPMAELIRWSQVEFGVRKRKLEGLLKELKIIRESNKHYVSGESIKLIERQIDEMLIEEEIYWRRISRAVWLKEGDKNTKFFPSKASSGRRKNTIREIFNEKEQWIEETDEVGRLFYDYFDKLFTTAHPSQNQLEEALKNMSIKVNADINDQLNQHFSGEEIVAALNQMHLTKAPGLDG